ncbi:hypothetical protein L912_1358 [Escherichia coli SCD1]|nr:hypothetical protein L912_1358 [Escherichia coli SCD1]
MTQIYAVVEDGMVINVVVWDGKSTWKPDAGIAILTDGMVSIGWRYDGKAFNPPPLPQKSREELIQAAENERRQLLAHADAVMQDWRTELMLGEISDVNKAKLSAWLAYKNEVKSADVTTDPEHVNWPVLPEA